MNMMPLSEAELDELEALLDSEMLAADAMGLDQLQAFFCALASGPEPVGMEVWLPEVWGSPAFADADQEARALSLILRLQAQVTHGLSSDEGVAPLLYPLDEEGEDLDYATWVDAYLYGSGMGEQPWYEAAGAHGEDLATLMEGFFLLNGSLKEDVVAAGEPWMSPAEEAKWIAQTQEALPDLVQSVFDFWEAHRHIPDPIRREGAKVGRNDPCPCGSGRKFKQCCGKDE